MNVLKFFLFISVLKFSQCAVIEEYNSYKDYKLFQINSRDGVFDLINDFKEIDVSNLPYINERIKFH